MSQNKSVTDITDYRGFKVWTTEDKDGISVNNVKIGILPYKLNGGLLSDVSLVANDGMSHLITTEYNGDDIDLLTAAGKYLKREFDVEVSSSSKWQFLGSLRLSEITNEKVHVFGVDVTDANTENLKFLPVSNALVIDDALILASFIRLYNTYYNYNK